MTRVLLALDETEQSVHAGRVAHRLFGDDAEYLAVNVAAIPVAWTTAGMAWGGVTPWVVPGAFSDGDPLGEQEMGDLRSGAEDAAASVAREAGVVPTEVMADTGDPVEVILDAAERHHVDVVVVGSHGKGWWSRLATGSVSESLVRRAEIPVLVIKEPHPDH